MCSSDSRRASPPTSSPRRNAAATLPRASHATQHPPRHRDRRDGAPFSPGALQTSSLPLFPHTLRANKVAELLHWRRSRARRGLFTTSAPTGYPQPASLGLPPRDDRSLRPRRALAQDHTTPPQLCVRARGPSPWRSLGGPLLGGLNRIATDSERPRNARAESRSMAVSRRACVTLHSPGFASLHFSATTDY